MPSVSPEPVHSEAPFSHQAQCPPGEHFLPIIRAAFTFPFQHQDHLGKVPWRARGRRPNRTQPLPSSSPSSARRLHVWRVPGGTGEVLNLARSSRRTKTKEHQCHVPRAPLAKPKGRIWTEGPGRGGSKKKAGKPERAWPFLELEVVQRGQSMEGKGQREVEEVSMAQHRGQGAGF